MKLFLDKEVKSLNYFIKHSHWGRRNRDKKQWLKVIDKVINNYTGIYYNKITIISIRKRLLDMDNLIGGAKTLIDSLVDKKLIKDDSPDLVKIDYKQRISKTKGIGTEVIFYKR